MYFPWSGGLKIHIVANILKRVSLRIMFQYCMSFSICLMISHRLPAHWPKRLRRRRKSSTVRRQHSPLTWPQALPAPPKWWVSSMTKHERMLRVVCHLFSWKLWSHNLQFSATRFPAYPADVNRWPSSAVLCSGSPLCNPSLLRAVWGLTPGLWSFFTQICHQTAMSCTTEGNESAASTPSDPTEQSRSWPCVTWAKVPSH